MFSRLGVYMRLPGVDVDRFAESMQSGGLMGYFDALTGGSISKVGVFSLGQSVYLAEISSPHVRILLHPLLPLDPP